MKVNFKPKLILFVMPAERENLVKTSQYYETLFGMEFSRTWTDLVKVFYAPISIDATMFSVEWRALVPGEDHLTPFPVFAVPDLDEWEEKLVKLGGKVWGPRFELPIAESGMPKYRETMLGFGLHESQITNKVGTMRRMQDPNGNQMCLLQPDPHSLYAFKLGPYRVGMTQEQMDKWKQELKDARELGLEPV